MMRSMRATRRDRATRDDCALANITALSAKPLAGWRANRIVTASSRHNADGAKPTMQPHEHHHLAQLERPDTRTRLCAVGLNWSAVDSSACAALRFLRTIDDPPRFVGLVGGASSGKSTLFNSLVGGLVSEVSASAHQTLGPIGAVHRDTGQRLDDWTQRGLLSPFGRVQWLEDRRTAAGAPDRTCIYRHDNPALGASVLIDLPDVTSAMSHTDGDVTRTLLAWLDAVVVVVDEERLFDAAVFEDVCRDVRSFGSRVAVVFNQTQPGHTDWDGSDARLNDIAARYDISDHYISPYVPGRGYRPLAAGLVDALVHWISDGGSADRRLHLARHVQTRCQTILTQNVTRAEARARLLRDIDRYIASVADDARLTIDLLRPEEQRLLGIGHRLLPFYETLRTLPARIFGARRPRSDEPDFEKRETDLAQTLAENFKLRINTAAEKIRTLVDDSGYLDEQDTDWQPHLAPPDFDATAWAARVRAHIDAWKDESRRLARKSDVVGMWFVPPLLVADLLFLGGAGMTLWSAAAYGLTGWLGGKGVAALAQKSPAFEAYQTTVRNYQAYIRESLDAMWRAQRETMPRRHLDASDPITESLMHCATPDAAIR